jgi:hypothetical protein
MKVAKLPRQQRRRGQDDHRGASVSGRKVRPVSLVVLPTWFTGLFRVSTKRLMGRYVSEWRILLPLGSIT